MPITDIALHEATRYRYLSYAMSVITARALPDVRDGLKPVQRRVLFAMYHNLKLLPQGRYRKSAAVVGEVMAKYHPHGDSSIYESMVRMSQSFSLLHPLVDGQGNFGSMDGDGAAAMRYTEAKLTPLSTELLNELKQNTVDWRANYDGQHSEPGVLPAQFPNLLINGAEGIAVGMSTRIPPHNLREVLDACVALIDNPNLRSADLSKKVKAPDFPTGGMILNSKDELQGFYETGSGIVKVRGTWELEKEGRRTSAIITSVPYGTNKATLVEKIGELIAQKKIPQLQDIRDESTDEVRVVIDLKIAPNRSAETEMQHAMAYLCKYTPLQSTFPMNITCLVPTDNPEVCKPLKANLYDVLRYWLDFRMQTVVRRLNYDLQRLRDQLHILEAFAKAFDALDEIIQIIRKSDGRADAKEKLMQRFGFDHEQTDAILDMRLYKLAKLEIHAIETELQEKRLHAAGIESTLGSNTNLWNLIRDELTELRKLYGQKRMSQIGGEEAETTLADESAYIIDETNYIIVSENGWIKRQKKFTTIDKIRLKEGDKILAIAKASTKSPMIYFSNFGMAYVQRITDIPSSTGYGDPIQKYFAFADGEKLVSAMALDALSLPNIPDTVPIEDPDHTPPYGIALSKQGRIIRFSLASQQEITNKSGRRYMKIEDIDDHIIAVYPAIGNEWVSLFTHQTRALCFPISDITLVRGPGKGVTAIKLENTDYIAGFELAFQEDQGITLETSRGRSVVINAKQYKSSRAAKGSKLLQRGTLSDWIRPLLRLDQMFKHTKPLTEQHSEDADSSEETVDVIANKKVSPSTKSNIEPSSKSPSKPVPLPSKEEITATQLDVENDATPIDTTENKPENLSLFPTLEDKRSKIDELLEKKKKRLQNSRPSVELSTSGTHDAILPSVEHSTSVETNPPEEERKRPKIIVRANYSDSNQLKLF